MAGSDVLAGALATLQPRSMQLFGLLRAWAEGRRGKSANFEGLAP